MADKERLQSPGDFFIDGVMIVGSSGARINVTDQVRELNIYQDLDSPFMSGSILLADSMGVAELLPFLGQERLLFSIKTPTKRAVDFNKYHAIIYNVQKRFANTDKEQSFLLNWTTLDHYRNTRTKISESFDGTISEIVTKILKGKNYLGTNKSINIEKTKNLRQYVFPNLTPFQAINLMKEEAVSDSESAPYFVFFENQDGYHFRSMDSLIGSMGNLNVPHQKTYKYQPSKGNSSRDPEDGLSTLLSWDVTNNNNSFLCTRHGMYSSTLYFHDIFNKNVQKFEYSYGRDRVGKRNSLNQESKNVGSIVPSLKTDGGKRLDQYPCKTFVHPTGSDNLHTKGTDNNAEEWLQESRSRELEQDYFDLKIETYGDTNIQVGDIINVVIPSNKPQAAPVVSDSIDPILSGRYLITQLHHLVIPTEQRHQMIMNVMKDSIENAPPIQDLKYPTEPSGGSDIGLEDTKRTLKPRTKGSGGKTPRF